MIHTPEKQQSARKPETPSEFKTNARNPKLMVQIPQDTEGKVNMEDEAFIPDSPKTNFDRFTSKAE